MWGDQELEALITQWVARHLALGDLKQVDAWLPGQPPIPFSLHSTVKASQVRSSNDSSKNKRAVNKKNKVATSCRIEIELPEAKFSKHAAWNEDMHRRDRLRSLFFFSPAKENVGGVEDFQALLLCYQRSFVTTQSLRNWYENGFSCWNQLLHLVMMHANGSESFGLIVYLLGQGARPDYQKNGVSTLARSYEVLSKDTNESNFRVYFLLMALNDLLYDEKTIAPFIRMLKTMTGSAVWSNQIIEATQSILLNFVHRMPSRQQVASSIEFKNLVRIYKENQKSLWANEHRRLLTAVFQIFANRHYQQVIQGRFQIAGEFRFGRVLEDELQVRGVSATSLFAYQKELSSYETMELMKKDQLEFQLQLLSSVQLASV